MNILGFLVGFVLIVIGIWAFFKALTGLLKFLMGAVILAMIALIVYNELQSNNVDTTGLLQTVTHKWTEIEGIFEKHFDKIPVAALLAICRFYFLVFSSFSSLFADKLVVVYLSVGFVCSSSTLPKKDWSYDLVGLCGPSPVGFARPP